MAGALLGILPPAQPDVIRPLKLEGHGTKEAVARPGPSAPLVKIDIHRALGRPT